MEMPGRRSDYSLLSQIPDEEVGTGASTSFYESIAAGGNVKKGRTDRVFDWDGSGDHRLNTQTNRIGNLYSWVGLQRHSSGSSYDDSSLSSDYYAPTLSNAAANEINALGYIHDDEFRVKAVGSGGSSGKSWAQKTEESYQLQQALALRLSSEATCADDPNFMDPMPDVAALRSLSSSAEAISHRFWVNGCMSYFEKVPDGFYLIHGMDPYVWSLCTNLQEDGRIPSFESLKTVDSNIGSSIEVVLMDRHSDSSLKELRNRVHNISSSCITTKEVADHLAKLVCNHLGGSVSEGEDDLVSSWRECSNDLKECLGSAVIPLCSLSVGLCRHRALLFKVLADSIDLPCRIARGCKYCTRDDASSCLVRFGLDREYLIDLIGKPGCLCEPDSLLNGPSSISISSPLRFPRLKPIESTIDFRSLAKQYFLDSQSLNIVFDEASSGNVVSGKDAAFSVYQRPLNRKDGDGKNIVLTGDRDINYQLLNKKAVQLNAQDGNSEQFRSCVTSQYGVQSTPFVENIAPLNHISQIGSKDSERLLGLSHLRVDHANNLSFLDGGQLIRKPNELSLGMEDLVIPWADLVLREKIGAGSFGTVYHADWNGSDVAVKILMEQDLHAERFDEFLREVAIMKCLRHPNIVLFMGAVTEPPNLSIVTEYLSRGSLHRLLHRPGAREVLDERRRLNMAYDVAKGMNYLHKRNPPIVHRDLKSPNLLVDKKYTVKVCDFGLSRLKAHTFLSSKSAAGTPEWMAPEVLRDEPSNEKSDVYSFGVILWELATLQQPWGNLNPAQVVAAVGFKGKRLEIPRDLNPQVATIIEACFASEPCKRPSFYEIMESLKPLIKPAMPHQVRSNMSLVTQ
ncbi:serine/threonine-protein kinase CTR1-like [Benincasa hispida]|uniref:serine/threonine-protein kinase CTR1-like n=1 Tax=Benincasa hispida TaxID=102211 RepID=UPI0019017F8B|nr:serine/threonine-protein kinase CTR1-like [Benincasa hispida]XP_038881632.1 serine/threonine-protein kinase CTR1-like [Benincasa hispida]XP_038881633.1 serine/threonine-protein kinase CTR1-like [Benincasa hispida]XP_038881634.1 serine/threonine-protein kinase CTR1-like [Benincasa hispida]XP_038881635.1 serine/threonine-protein kinase CTR1-like [Benincasa hispida]XP_038881636.1 serine/threonine-protein kinase CTR1-like [Benincasa hispida]